MSENLNNSANLTMNMNTDIQNATGNKFTYKKCEDCSDAMKKVLNQHIELVTLQDEVEKIKEIKSDLEAEIENRNSEIFEKNEKILLIEMQTKNFIKSQHNSINDLILKLDQIFLFNQKKFSLSSCIKNFYDNITNEFKELKNRNMNVNINTNNPKENPNFYVNISNNSFEKIIRFIEDSYINLQKIERLILNDNKIFNRIIEIMNEISFNLENHISANFEEGNFDDENILSSKRGNIANNQNYNNINLNFNKNININIINSKDKDEVNTSSISNNKYIFRKNISISNSDFSGELANQNNKRTHSFSYFDREVYYKKKTGKSLDATNNRLDLKAISIFNNIKSN